MKYSLRSLMIVVTLVCVVLGGVGRIASMRGLAAHHDAVAETIHGTIAAQGDLPPSLHQHPLETHHRLLAEEYRRAIYRPWSLIDESKQLEPTP